MSLEEGQDTGENFICFKCLMRILIGEKYVFARMKFLIDVVAFFAVHEDCFVEAMKNYRPTVNISGGPA